MMSLSVVIAIAVISQSVGSAEEESTLLQISGKQMFNMNNFEDHGVCGDCPEFEELFPDLVKVELLTSETTHSNLGGKGPDGGKEELYYKNVAVAADQVYDMRVTALSPYTPEYPDYNGNTGYYGQINILVGTTVDLKFQFIDQKTGEVATIPKVMISWFDLDEAKKEKERESVILWPGHSDTLYSTLSEVVPAKVPCPAGAGGGTCEQFTSSTEGNFQDNPQNPGNLTELQASRSFAVYYEDITEFKVTLSAGAGKGHRNFLFTGMSEVACAIVEPCCPDHICGCKSECEGLSSEEKCTLSKCKMCPECKTEAPTDAPTDEPTEAPTNEPTDAPTDEPTEAPTNEATDAPTEAPTDAPTDGATTTTTTASKEKVCEFATSFEFVDLVENTLGEPGGRLFFKDVAKYEDQVWDMSITDVSGESRYAGQGKASYQSDHRNHTGQFRGAGRIAIDHPGSYVFRFQFMDASTGDAVKVPLVPLTFYDVDNEESIGACGVNRAITQAGKTRLKEKKEGSCFTHTSKAKEVNSPKDFDFLNRNQKKHTVTYVYSDAIEMDVFVEVAEDLADRYIVFKGSKVLACEYEDRTKDKEWKKKGPPKDELGDQ